MILFHRHSALLFKILISLCVESVWDHLFELFESARIVVHAFFENQSFSIVFGRDKHLVVGLLTNLPEDVTGIFDVSVVVRRNKLLKNVANLRVMCWVKSVRQHYFSLFELFYLVDWLFEKLRDHKLSSLVGEWVDQSPYLGIVHLTDLSWIPIVICGKLFKTRGIDCVCVIVSIGILHILSLWVIQSKFLLILVSEIISQIKFISVCTVLWESLIVSCSSILATSIKEIVFPNIIHICGNGNLNKTRNDRV